MMMICRRLEPITRRIQLIFLIQQLDTVSTWLYSFGRHGCQRNTRERERTRAGNEGGIQFPCHHRSQSERAGFKKIEENTLDLYWIEDGHQLLVAMHLSRPFNANLLWFIIGRDLYVSQRIKWWWHLDRPLTYLLMTMNGGEEAEGCYVFSVDGTVFLSG